MILVTGSAGFIGSHLLDALRATGADVEGLDRRASPWTDRRVDLATDELDLDGASTIFHLAGQPGVRRSFGRRFEEYVRDNIVATQRLLEAAVPGTRFVLASSSSVYGQADVRPTPESCATAPRSPYGVTKAAAEQLLGVYPAVRATVLRLFTVYGPRQRADMAFASFCRAALSGASVELHGDGTQTRDFTFVSDVVAAFLACAEAPGTAGQTINIGAGSPCSLLDALDVLGCLVGQPMGRITHPAAAGDVADTAADIGLARALLGFAPVVGLREGLAAQVAATSVTLHPS